MKTEIFVEAFHDFNERFIKLMESLSALHELSCINIFHQDNDQLIAKALEILMEYQHFERCSVFLAQGDTLVNVAGLDWQELFEPQTRDVGAARLRTTFRIGEGVIGLAAKTGELQHCRNCITDFRFKFLACGDRSVQGSIIAVPVVVDKEIFGVLNAYHPHPFSFTEEHERLLTIFSKVLGQLLAINRYVRTMEQMVRDRTQELEAALREAKDLKTRYEQLSVIDELTELHNRRFFFPEAEAALARAMRYQQPFSLLILDIDYFKLVNDTLGHATGDRVLKDVAAALKEESRAGDILARFGGEEFVFALPNTELPGARLLAERMREHIKTLEWDVSSDEPLSISVSIGVTTLQEYIYDRSNTRLVLEALLAQADKSLYYCKKQGRDQVATYRDLPDADK